MAEPIRPDGVKAQGFENHYFVFSMANPAAPTAAELNHATTIEMSGRLYEGQFDNLSQSTSSVNLPSRVADTVVYKETAPAELTGGVIRYQFDPQGAPASDGRDAYESLPDGTEVFWVRRFGIAKATAPVATHRVTVVKIRVGMPLETKVGDGAGQEVAIEQPYEPIGDYNPNVAVV